MAPKLGFPEFPYDSKVEKDEDVVNNEDVV